MGGRKKVTWGDLPLFLMDFCGLATPARKRLLMSVLFEAFCSSLAGGSFLGVWIISMGSLFKTLTVGWCCWEPCPLPRASVEESSFSVVFAWAEVVHRNLEWEYQFQKGLYGILTQRNCHHMDVLLFMTAFGWCRFTKGRTNRELLHLRKSIGLMENISKSAIWSSRNYSRSTRACRWIGRFYHYHITIQDLRTTPLCFFRCIVLRTFLTIRVETEWDSAQERYLHSVKGFAPNLTTS